MQVLWLPAAFEVDDLQAAVKTAMRLRAVCFDAVKHQVLCRVVKMPPKLDLDVHPYLLRATVVVTSGASHICLASGTAA